MKTDFLPEAFLKEMKGLLKDSYPDYLACFKEQPFAGLRANTLKISGEELRTLLPWKLSPVPWTPNGYYIEDPGSRPSLHPAYSAGLYYLQEPSAMAPAAVLPIEPGQRVLDLCAAPGGKSTQLAARLKGEGVLVSNDISPSRARGLLKNLEMTGAPSICVTAEAPEKLEKQWSGWFDRILVDAPCSGEGMFRKEPEMVRDWKERGPSHYSPIQRNILLQAARMLRPGGMLLYSTCTFSAEEDEGSVSWLLENDSEMRLLSLDPNVVPGSAESEILPGTLRLFPHLLRGEGHYLALLQKSGDTRNQNISQISAADELPGILCENQEVWSFLSQIPLFADAGLRLRLMETGGPKGKERGRNRRKERLSFEETQGEVYLLPKEMPAWHSLRFLRTGLHVGSLKEGRFEPSQALAMALKKEEYPLTWNLDFEDERVLRYLRGETLLLKDEEEEMEGWILVLAGGFPLGWARGKGKTLKNKYYPGWRRM